MLRCVVPVCLAFLALQACGGDDAGDEGEGAEGTSTSSGGSSGGASSGAGSSGAGSASSRGLVACGGENVDVYSDARHCGSCGHACGAAEICEERGCVAKACDAQTGHATCADQCRSVRTDIDHCGGCDTRCADGSLCYDSACIDVQGDGTSCASPVVFADDSALPFWFFDGATAHQFACGALSPAPAAYFRWTARKTGDVSAKVHGLTSDGIVLEAFDSAACDGTPLACQAQSATSEDLPELEFAATAGQTYFLVIGTTAASAPLGRFTLRMDD